MLRFKTLPIVLFPLALSACAASRSPVPLVGTSTDVGALTGEWAGEYSSSESGRSGSISFTLRAAGDSAFGDVVMIPRAWGRALVPWTQPDVVLDEEALHIQVEHLPSGLAHVEVGIDGGGPRRHDLEHACALEQPLARQRRFAGALGFQDLTRGHHPDRASQTIQNRQGRHL